MRAPHGFAAAGVPRLERAPEGPSTQTTLRAVTCGLRVNAMHPWVPLGPPLAVACYHNRVDEVKQLLADGADPLAVGPDGGIPPGLINRMPAIFQCVRFGYAECLKALLTVQIELAESKSVYAMRHLSPLLYLLFYMALPRPRQPVFGRPWYFEQPGSDPLECVRLLLDAGVSLETVRVTIDLTVSGGREVIHDPFDYARRSGNADVVRMLEDARRLRYSPKTHHRFPRPARYAAAELIRLCYQIEAGVLADVWAEHVIPFLVCRTTRDALFIDALSDKQVVTMLDGDHAEHARRELQRRGWIFNK